MNVVVTAGRPQSLGTWWECRFPRRAPPTVCPALFLHPPSTQRPCHWTSAVLTPPPDDALVATSPRPCSKQGHSLCCPSPMWVSTDPLILGRSGLLFHGHTLPHCSWGLGVSDPSRILGISLPQHDSRHAHPRPVLAATPPRAYLPPWPQHLRCLRLLSVQLPLPDPRGPRIPHWRFCLLLAEISRFSRIVTFTSPWPLLLPHLLLATSAASALLHPPAARSLPTPGYLEELPSFLVSLT